MATPITSRPATWLMFGFCWLGVGCVYDVNLTLYMNVYNQTAAEVHVQVEGFGTNSATLTPTIADTDPVKQTVYYGQTASSAAAFGWYNPSGASITDPFTVDISVTSRTKTLGGATNLVVEDGGTLNIYIYQNQSVSIDFIPPPPPPTLFQQIQNNIVKPVQKAAKSVIGSKR